MKQLTLISVLFIQTLFAGQTVEYKHKGKTFEGYLSKPSGPATTQLKPGILICHAWRGIQAHEKAVADRLAQSGVIAFVLDIYGKGIRPDNPKDARTQSSLYKKNRKLLRDHANAGLRFLRSLPQVEESKISAIGYCFGGTTVIELARSGAEVNGIVSFHGGLDSPSPADDKNIKTPILILHGAADPFVKAEDILAMKNGFDKANVTWSMVEFSGAVHAFTHTAAGNDVSKGAAYDKRADEQSWDIFASYFRRWSGIRLK